MTLTGKDSIQCRSLAVSFRICVTEKLSEQELSINHTEWSRVVTESKAKVLRRRRIGENYSTYIIVLI